MDYRQSLEQAIIYIENHLEEDIRVEQVANSIGYSYYHFNRQFTAILGESVGSYIKKRRLAKATQKLLYTDIRIIDIAIESNFESAEAFSRAFKAMYKISPKKYRKNRIHTYISSKECLDNNSLNHLLNHVTVHPQIVEIEDITIVGLKKKVGLQLNMIKEFRETSYAKLDQLLKENKKQRRFGIYETDNTNIHFTVNGEMLCNQIVGVEMEEVNKIENPYIIKVIKGGRYAVFTHSGSLDTLLQTIHYIWGTWFLSTKEKIDNRDTFEVYDERFLGFYHADSKIDIYVAIK